MSIVRRIVPLVAGGLLLAGMGQARAPDPLPGACDVLRALPTDALTGQSLSYQTTQDRAGDTMLMSMCIALGADDLPAITLLLRQDISEVAPQPAPAARKAMLAELADTFGQAPDAAFPEIGEAAMWVEEVGQLTVWYRAGRVMFIVTAGGIGPKADDDLAIEVARAIIARFP